MRRMLGVTVAAAAMLMVFAPPAGAGLDAAPLTVRKIPVGPVPAGTQFVVTIACDSPIIAPDGSSTAQLVFDAQGNPVGTDTVEFGDFGSCIVTETQTGGAASVTYECQGSIPPDQTGAGGGGRFNPRLSGREVRQVCPSSGPQSDPITVNIVDSRQQATVTITNTFVEPATAPAAPAPPVAVAGAPSFTG
jgi:hypothetical protein